LAYQDPIQFHNAQSESILPNIDECNKLIDKMSEFEGSNYLTKWRQQEKKNHIKQSNCRRSTIDNDYNQKS
jgi:hypothetical protein